VGESFDLSFELGKLVLYVCCGHTVDRSVYASSTSARNLNGVPRPPSRTAVLGTHRRRGATNEPRRRSSCMQLEVLIVAH